MCGADLVLGSAARRRLEDFIERQKTVDVKLKGLTEFHNEARVDLQRLGSAAPEWAARLDSLERARLSNRKAAAAARQQIQICEEKIRHIDRARLADTRRDRDAIRVALTAKQEERYNLQVEVSQQKKVVGALKPDYEDMLRRDVSSARSPPA